MTFLNLIKDTYVLLEQEQPQDAAMLDANQSSEQAAPSINPSKIDELGDAVEKENKLKEKTLATILKGTIDILNKASNEFKELQDDNTLKLFVKDMTNAVSTADIDYQKALDSTASVLEKYAETFNVKI